MDLPECKPILGNLTRLMLLTFNAFLAVKVDHTNKLEFKSKIKVKNLIQIEFRIFH
jgi:hypothetical protein